MSTCYIESVESEENATMVSMASQTVKLLISASLFRLNATRKLRVRSNPKLASMASRSCSSQISALCRRQHHFVTPNLVRYMLSDPAFKRANLVSSVYYYNMDTASCEVFLLGDCGTACAPGQCNRFTTLDDCNYYCA